jgi:glycosyltransferase involved in cell wall biosynthesis
MTSDRSGRRAAIYNRFWRSQGGGERHSGMIAEVLTRLGVQVDLLGHEEVDISAMAEHLGLDLSGCRLRVVPELGEAALSELTSDYDLFINASYTSRLPSQATHAAYLCYFPTPVGHDLAAWRRAASRTVGKFIGQPPRTDVTYGLGWFPAEGGRLRSWVWTSGQAELTLGAGEEAALIFEAGRPGQAATELEVRLGDEPILTTEVAPGFAKHRLILPATSAPRVLRFTSATFTPGGSDGRKLGVAISRLRLADEGTDPRRMIADRFPWITCEQVDDSYLATYDAVFANSRYTRGWIRKLWGRDSDVLYPPIQVERLHPQAVRTSSIVTAGRFFAPKLGHSKRQLEQVQVFTRMIDAGLLTGWTLHVIGGCEPSQRGYVDKVRAAAFGYPVELHVNAPRPELEQIMSSASIVWSATGLGEDENSAPWASEHFGMTTAEAMAAGCVPIVIDRAGQREIVRQGIDGFRWQTVRELAERTIQVVIDEPLRARMSASSVARARMYSDTAFAARLTELIERYDLI